MATLIKNNKAYDSADVHVNIDGIIYDEIKEISYSVKEENQLNKSLKKKATSWSSGFITPEASITIYMKDAVSIERKGLGDLLRIRPFNINVSYINDYNEIINDTVIAKFQSQGREVKGDMGLAYQYDLFALDVQFQTQ